VVAPHLHFISGKAVEKIRNGAMISYVLKLIITSQHARETAFVLEERFAVSFDPWEEKYSVVQRKPDGRSALNAQACTNGSGRWGFLNRGGGLPHDQQDS
jgi:hypothetical protein